MYNNGADSGASNPSLTNVTFFGNTATYGGAIFNDGHQRRQQPQPHQRHLLRQYRRRSSAARSSTMASGGASSPSLTNVTFFSNTAS